MKKALPFEAIVLHIGICDATLPNQFGPREAPKWPDPCSPCCVTSSGCDGGRHLFPLPLSPTRKLSSIPSTESTKSRFHADRERESLRLAYAGEKAAVNKSPAGLPSYSCSLEREKGGRGVMRKSGLLLCSSFFSFYHFTCISGFNRKCLHKSRLKE